MMNFLRKHMRKIFIITILAFIGGIFMGFGAYLFGPAKDYEKAATVNGKVITMQLFKSVYTNSVDMMRRSSKETPSEEMLNEIKVKTLQALIQDEIFYQVSQDYGIIVTDAELKSDIQSSYMFKYENKFEPQMYYAFLNALRMTPREYEDVRRKQIAGEKVKIILGSSVKVSDSEYNEAVANGLTISRDEMLQNKANEILNNWFINLAKNSNITTNDLVFK